MTARVIFREAVDRELMTDNPAARIRPPKVNPQPAKFLTWEELSEIDFGKQTKRIQFLALHGLRYGEAAALRPEDCYDGMVHITKSKYGPTKTRSGVRAVPQLAEYVEFKKNQNPIARVLKPYGVTVHSLRKTYAYTLKKSNVHVTTAAKLMGHSNPMVTLRVYTQVLNEETHQAGKSIADYVAEVRATRES